LVEILIKSFNGIGDLLFVTPTLRRIKESYPDSKIIVNTNYPLLLEDNPFVDEVNTRGKEGVFLGYDDPIHRKWPRKHHILRDWEIVCQQYRIQTGIPDLKPEIYFKFKKGDSKGHIGVQTIHKNHWHGKKNWGNFDELAEQPGFQPIPKLGGLREIVEFLTTCRAVVCAEGGISHLCRALDIPCVVVYGGFADPEWNGYKEQINVTNRKYCSYCYNPGPCINPVEKECMEEIKIGIIKKATILAYYHLKSTKNENGVVLNVHHSLI